jgi:hypothetical protein
VTKSKKNVHVKCNIGGRPAVSERNSSIEVTKRNRCPHTSKAFCTTRKPLEWSWRIRTCSLLGPKCGDSKMNGFAIRRVASRMCSSVSYLTVSIGPSTCVCSSTIRPSRRLSLNTSHFRPVNWSVYSQNRRRSPFGATSQNAFRSVFENAEQRRRVLGCAAKIPG